MSDGNVNLIDLGNTLSGWLAIGVFLVIVFMLWRGWRDDKDRKNWERKD